MSSKESDRDKFDIRWDVYGRREPEVVLYVPGTMTDGEVLTLSEAVRRGIVSEERARHAHAVNKRIREAVQRVSKGT